MNCKHQFIKIKEVTKPRPKDKNHEIFLNRFDDLTGAVVVCAECGARRTVWEDGQIIMFAKINNDDARPTHRGGQKTVE